MAKALHVTEAIGLGAEIFMRGALITDAAKIAKIEEQYSAHHNLYVTINLPDASAEAVEEH